MKEKGGRTWRAIVKFPLQVSTRLYLHLIGLQAGSEVAAAAFRHDFRTRLDRARFQVSPMVFHHAQQAFDVRKMEIGTDNEDELWLCPVEGLKHSGKHAFRDGHMLFTR